MLQYAQAIGILNKFDCGFHNQSEVDRTIASLKSIANCPESFRSEYKEIRCGALHETLQAIDDKYDNPQPPEPQPTPEEIGRRRFLERFRE